MRKLAIIPGDGVGPEVTAEAVKVLNVVKQRSGVDLQFDQFDYSVSRTDETGITIPPEQIEAFRQEYDALLIGALGNSNTRDGDTGLAVLYQLNLHLNLYLKYCPVEFIDFRYSPLKLEKSGHPKFWIFHENLEGLYAGAESFFKAGTEDESVMYQSVTTRRGLIELVRYIFEFARKNSLHKIAICRQHGPSYLVTKLLREISANVQRDYSKVKVTFELYDELLHRMLTKTDELEIILTCSCFGQILNYIAAEMQGGSSVAVEGCINPGKSCLFRPLHGPLEQIAGKNEANPLGAISASSNILKFLGLEQESYWIYSAINYALDTHNTTRDLGGRLSTIQVGDFVADQIRKSAHH